MVKDAHYLWKLIDASIAISKWQKVTLLTYMKQNPDSIWKLIEIFEEEQKWLKDITTDYKDVVTKIWTDLKQDLEKWKDKKDMKEQQNIGKTIKDIQSKEQQEDEDIESIINAI